MTDHTYQQATKILNSIDEDIMELQRLPKKGLAKLANNMRSLSVSLNTIAEQIDIEG